MPATKGVCVTSGAARSHRGRGKFTQPDRKKLVYPRPCNTQPQSQGPGECATARTISHPGLAKVYLSGDTPNPYSGKGGCSSKMPLRGEYLINPIIQTHAFGWHRTRIFLVIWKMVYVTLDRSGTPSNPWIACIANLRKLKLPDPNDHSSR